MLRSTMLKKSSDAVVQASIKNNAGILTLNRPKALNSLNLEMVNLMSTQLTTWKENNPDLKLIIQNSSLPKAFCAGGDVRSITEAGLKGDTEAGRTFFGTEYKLDYKLATYHVPVVSLISGITMGGGVGITVHGTFRVATEKTMFAMPETGIGLFPDVGGGYFLPRVPHGPELGTFLALTGFRLKSVDNLHAGVATHICSTENLNELTEALTKCTTKENIEDILLEYQEKSLRETTDLNKRFTLEDHLPIIKNCFKYDSIDEIKQALVDASDLWATKQYETLNKMSPTSLAVSLEQIRRGAKMSLEEVLNMELGIASECLNQKDFYFFGG